MMLIHSLNSSATNSFSIHINISYSSVFEYSWTWKQQSLVSYRRSTNTHRLFLLSRDDLRLKTSIERRRRRKKKPTIWPVSIGFDKSFNYMTSKKKTVGSLPRSYTEYIVHLHHLNGILLSNNNEINMFIMSQITLAKLWLYWCRRHQKLFNWCCWIIETNLNLFHLKYFTLLRWEFI